jgi:PPP family 3-phenylpropionic acid transporter
MPVGAPASGLPTDRTEREPAPIWSPAIVYSIFFGGIGAAFPYLPVYYRSIGVSVEGVGFLSALAALVGLIAAPIWGSIADQLGDVRRPLLVAGLWAAGGATLLGLAREPLAVGIAVAAWASGMAGIIPLIDSRTVEMMGGSPHRYGRARAFGSAAFVVVALATGTLIDRTSQSSLFLVFVPALALTGIASYLLLAGGRRAETPTRRMRVSRADVAGLLRLPRLGLFLVGAIFFWSTNNAVAAFLSIHMTNLGAPAHLVGLAWAIGATVEVPLMFAFPAIAGRLGGERLLVIASTAYVARAVGFALAPTPEIIVGLSVLSGVGFAFFYVGSVTYVATHAPPRLRATAQGVFTGTANSVGTVAGSTIGGIVASAITIPGMYAAAAVATLLAGLVVARAVLPQRERDPALGGVAADRPKSLDSGQRRA